MSPAANKAFQTDKVAVSHLLQKAQKLRHNNFAAEQRRSVSQERSELAISPQNFVENEAWILFKLNETPVETKADGDFYIYAIMDVATGLIHGMEFSPSNSAELSEFEAKKLLNSARAKAGSLPKQLFVDAARKFGRVKLAASSLGIRFTPEDGLRLDSITEGARVGFAAQFGTGLRR